MKTFALVLAACALLALGGPAHANSYGHCGTVGSFRGYGGSYGYGYAYAQPLVLAYPVAPVFVLPVPTVAVPDPVPPVTFAAPIAAPTAFYAPTYGLAAFDPGYSFQGSYGSHSSYAFGSRFGNYGVGRNVGFDGYVPNVNVGVGRRANVAVQTGFNQGAAVRVRTGGVFGSRVRVNVR